MRRIGEALDEGEVGVLHVGFDTQGEVTSDGGVRGRRRGVQRRKPWRRGARWVPTVAVEAAIADEGLGEDAFASGWRAGIGPSSEDEEGILLRAEVGAAEGGGVDLEAQKLCQAGSSTEASQPMRG